MNFETFLATLLQALLIAAVPVCAAYIGKGLGALAAYFAAKTDNETVKKYLEDVADAVSTAVIYTSQTYVDALKASGTFNEENQREALQKAMEKAKSLLTKEALEFLAMTYGDLTNYLETKIEAEVKKQKKEEPAAGILVETTTETTSGPDMATVAAATAAATAAVVVHAATPKTPATEAQGAAQAAAQPSEG